MSLHAVFLCPIWRILLQYLINIWSTRKFNKLQDTPNRELLKLIGIDRKLTTYDKSIILVNDTTKSKMPFFFLFFQISTPLPSKDCHNWVLLLSMNDSHVSEVKMYYCKKDYCFCRRIYSHKCLCWSILSIILENIYNKEIWFSKLTSPIVISLQHGGNTT